MPHERMREGYSESDEVDDDDMDYEPESDEPEEDEEDEVLEEEAVRELLLGRAFDPLAVGEKREGC